MWLRQVLDWQRDVRDPKEFMEDLKISLFHDEMFVFTPNGDLIKLPRHSTPIDFAFAVHTDVGLHCIGAKVNGKIVPLTSPLKSGDSIEIITSAKQSPNRDWLKFVQTTKARSRIKKCRSTRLPTRRYSKKIFLSWSVPAMNWKGLPVRWAIAFSNFCRIIKSSS